MAEPIVWIYVASAAAGLAVAALVFFARPGRLQNRLLALALFLGAFIDLGAAGLHLWDGTAAASNRANLMGSVRLVAFTAFAMPAAYLAFLGTLDTRWSRGLDSNRARTVLAGLVALAWATLLSDLQVIGERLTLPVLLLGAVGLYGLVVAISYWRATQPGTLRRRQAKAYAWAFGTRDLLFALFGTLNIFTNPALLDLPSIELGGGFLASWFPAIGTLLFAPLAAYGILSTQLFEIDLKIKWTLEKSTVAAIFVAVFFVVSEGAQVLLADFAGSELLGVLAAGALVFFLAPLQRLGERVSDTAMPGVEDTPEYRARRKEEIYRAQLEELLADDQVTAKERRALLRLQESLNIDGDTANSLEREVLGASGGEA